LVLVGCNSDQSKADRLMKEKLALMEKTAVAFEAATDKASAAQAMTEYKTNSEKLMELDIQFNALPIEAKNGAIGANSIQHQQVSERLTKAKAKVSKLF